jgi:hypothetical protein
MGLNVDALAAGLVNQQLDRESFDAPLRLQAESYESFAKLLHSSVGQDGAANASVTEELRRLQIDPEVFYRDARRLGVREYRPDELDPGVVASNAAPGAFAASPAHATLATLLANDSESCTGGTVGGPECTSALDSFEPPARGPHATYSEPVNIARAKEIESYHIESEADTACKLGMCGLNVPESGCIEETGCEEILLNDADEETRGGRLSCATPKGLEAKLQIDSLTDDEDDEVFKTTQIDSHQADDADEIEAFVLDPDFDYDKVDNLTRRL